MKNKSFVSKPRMYIVEWVALIISLIFIGFFIFYTLFLEHSRIINDEKKRLSTQSKIVEDNLSLRLESAYNALETIRNKVRNQGFINLKSLEDDLILFTKILPAFRTFDILNEDGIVVVSNRSANINLDSRNKEFFQVLKSDFDEDKLFISRPYKTVLGTWTVSVSLKITNSQGDFLGVVVAKFEPEKLMELLDSVFYYTKDMRASIIHSNGIVFLITPDYQEALGKSFSGENTLIKKYILSGERHNTCIGLSDLSKDKRVQVFYAVVPENIKISSPLYITISRNYNSLFERFDKEVFILLSFFVIFSLLSILTLYLYQKARYKEVKKQKNKERRLETFAYVDSLTKIPNRRYFDETFIKEWESCLKEQNIICVILIDVDFFKNYNDSYRHQLGDECLASIASALRMSVNRSGDLIARDMEGKNL